MITYTFTVRGSVDVDLLRSELETVGYFPTGGSRRGEALTIEFDQPLDSTAVQRIVNAHQPAEYDQLDQLIAKARRVWAGNDSFTQAQAQKILAGLVLVVSRYLR